VVLKNLAFVPAILVVAVGAAFLIRGGKPDETERVRGVERCSTSSPLRSLTSAQADFKSADRDGNGMDDFWRKDIAGLYATPGADRKPIALIPLSLALADESPARDWSGLGARAPVEGYWLRAIPHEDEAPAKPDPQRFAYVMYPADVPNPPKYTFIVDENNTIYRTVLPRGMKVTVFPSDLGGGLWSKLD
jgi:hypothetical protein